MAELQEAVEDLPRFCLFYIAFGLELIALILSAIADVSPHDKERVKKVALYFFLTCYSAELFGYSTFFAISRHPHPQNPEAGAPFLSRITFNWINR